MLLHRDLDGFLRRAYTNTPLTVAALFRHTCNTEVDILDQLLLEHIYAVLMC